MARRRQARKPAPEVPVSSFSDIAFLLIIFFILATTLVQIKGVVHEIPSGEKAEAQEEKESASVQLQGSKILLNEEHVDIPELRKRLAKMNLNKKKGDEKVVLLEADGMVTYQTYFDVMSSISAAGGVTAIVQEEK